jgi:hypothetical protein
VKLRCIVEAVIDSLISAHQKQVLDLNQCEISYLIFSVVAFRGAKRVIRYEKIHFGFLPISSVLKKLPNLFSPSCFPAGQ